MKRDFSYEAYLNGTHRLGRIFSVLTLIMLTGAPFAIGGILGAMPDLAAAAAVAMGIFIWLKEKKHLDWVENFAVAGSMLIGMLVVVLIHL